jgi:hypothetical protein
MILCFLAASRRGSNAGRRSRFKARKMPIRANIVGPPYVATKISASIAVCHSAAVCSAFGSFVISAVTLRPDL